MHLDNTFGLNPHASYQRILLKLSGEALQGAGACLNADSIARVVTEIVSVVDQGVQIAIVVGAGNLIRGSELVAAKFERITSDQMGMLSTIINGLALRDALAAANVPVVLMSALNVSPLAQLYDRFNALLALDQGKVVVLVGGTGNPLVTTDTAAALRGIELKADIILKATKVDGVFDSDPQRNSNAQFYPQLSYEEILQRRLQVMDLAAILLCQEHNLPLRVFNLKASGSLGRIVMGAELGTLIK